MDNQRMHRAAECWCGHGGASHRNVEGGRLVCRACAGPPPVEEAEPMVMAERRRFERVPIPHPIRTSIGQSPAYVVDASIAGIGVLHHQPSPAVGSACRLMFYSEYGPITLQCEIVRSTPAIDEATYQSGMRIIAADQESEARLRALVMALSMAAQRHSNH